MRFDTAIFTNLTQDHLDFHGTMAAPWRCETKLFTDFPLRHRVINADDSFGRDLISLQLPDTISYGLQADVRGSIRAMRRDGMHLTISYAGDHIEVQSAIGRFNASNLFAVAAALLVDGVQLAEVGAVLPKPRPLQGACNAWR